jgi:hypothetical protein
MGKYTDEQIYANRVKAVEFLKKGRKKANGALIQGGSRCNIGWLAEAMEIPKDSRSVGFLDGTDYNGDENVENAQAPAELVEMLGLHDENGSIDGDWDDAKDNPFVLAAKKAGYKRKFKDWKTDPNSIIELNDSTGCSIRQFGHILDHMICGGDDTPWKAIGKPKKGKKK